MDIKKKTYLFNFIEGFSMILFGVFMVAESYMKIKKETVMLIVSLNIILIIISTILGIYYYVLVKRQYKKTNEINNLKNPEQTRYIKWYLLFNLIMVLRLIIFIVA